jgi:hypothetical protein
MPRNWVLAVGCNITRNHAPLPAARYDAFDIAFHVAENWQSDPDHTVVLTGRSATTRKISAALHEILVRRAEEQDRIFVYLSGHIDPNVRQITGSLVTSDFSKDLRNYGVNLRTLRYIVEDSPAAYVLVLIDACYSGVIAQADRHIAPHGFYFSSGIVDAELSTKLFITAVSSGRFAYAHAGMRNSDFTGVVLDVLRGTRNRTEHLSTGEFYEAIANLAVARGLSPPIRSGTEVGSTEFMLPSVGCGPVSHPHSFVTPVWLRDVLKAEPRRRATADACTFVRDVNYPDGTILPIGARIRKRWRIRNTGRVAWRNRFILRIGEPRATSRIHSEVLTPVPFTRPDEEVEIEIEMTMPTVAAAVHAVFKMVDATGRVMFPSSRGLSVSFEVTDREEDAEAFVEAEYRDREN